MTSNERLRAVPLIVLLVGALVSVGFVFRAGNHGGPKLVTVVIAIWVIAPFIALLLAAVVSRRWTVAARTFLYRAMLVVTLGSLLVYAQDAIWPRRAQAAFVFVMVPLVTWVLFAVIVLAALFIFRRQGNRKA